MRFSKYKMSILAVALIVSQFGIVTTNEVKYEPNWNSIDSRPLPSWYDEAKLGIFIHWGVFSVPSFHSEWFWKYWHDNVTMFVDYVKQNFRPDFTYADFASMFSAEFYDPFEWAEIFNSSGARYIVFVSKHHEGFTNWPSKHSFNWNSMDVGPKRDLVGELAHAIRTKTPNIKFGVYHSLFEWFNPVYLQDSANNFQTRDFPESKTIPELYELVNNYKPEIIWSDGAKGPDVYWNSTGFLAWLYNESPVKDTVVVNDRWGFNASCKHGGYWTCKDRYLPGHLVTHKWEDAMTITKSGWGYRRDANLEDYLTIEELVKTLVEAVSCGGNMLMNVGPRHDGKIDPIFQERLKQMGSWLAVNGEAIYSTKPWSHQNDTVMPNVWYTSKKGSTGTSVYAILLSWPEKTTFTLGAPAPNTGSTVVSLIGVPGNLNWQTSPGGGITIDTPVLNPNKMPCQWAWTFKLDGLRNA